MIECTEDTVEQYCRFLLMTDTNSFVILGGTLVWTHTLLVGVAF